MLIWIDESTAVDSNEVAAVENISGDRDDEYLCSVVLRNGHVVLCTNGSGYVAMVLGARNVGEG